MVGLIKLLCSFNFYIGVIVGSVVVFIFKPLIVAGINKIINKND